MASKKIYETDAVRAFAAQMSPASKRKYLLAKSVLAEVKNSMAATQAELDVAMRDPVFRAEHERMMLKYDLQDALTKFFTKATYAKRFESFPKRQCFHLNIEFGAGTPTCVAEDSVAFAT